MTNDSPTPATTYSAPALEKGLDILEMLCRTERPLTQKEIAQGLGRTVSEIYRMLSCLVKRSYVGVFDESYFVTTKLFELAHSNPPIHRLLVEARPIMDKMAAALDLSCHLTMWGKGSQVVVAKVDAPNVMGFSVRLGAELDVIVSASGRVLLAFQEDSIRELRIAEAFERRPAQTDPDLTAKLDAIRRQGFESAHSVQLRGLHTISHPIADMQGHAVAALTIPYAERVDALDHKSIAEVETLLGEAASELAARLGGRRSEADR